MTRKARRHENVKAGRAIAPRRGFTLVELLIAVAVLLIVILATAKIFGSVSRVATLGQANADIMQEVAAIERQMRADLEAISPEGFLAIVSHRVRNDIRGTTNLLDPSREPDEYLRSDQLVFFAGGTHSQQVYGPTGVNLNATSTIARIYYGHGFQLPTAPAGTDLENDAANAFFPPWGPPSGTADLVWTNGGANAGTVPVPVTPATDWILARQAILLADDGGGSGTYLNVANSTDLIWNAAIRNSRVDVAASNLNDVRNFIDFNTTAWYDGSGGDGWSLVAGGASNLGATAVMFPRAEPISPSLSRVDQALTTTALASGCSEFMVEWTYEDGTGFVQDEHLNPWSGVTMNSVGERAWFGMPDEALDTSAGEIPRGVTTLTEYVDLLAGQSIPCQTIFPENIEGEGSYSGPNGTVDGMFDVNGDGSHLVYVAAFGYNRSRALDPTLVPAAPNPTLGYTPWPSSLRITMRLHDPENRLEDGRPLQFVIDLPERVR